MDTFLVLFLLPFIGSIAGLIGGIILIVKKEWAEGLSRYSLPFASGILLAVSLLHLIPESVHELGEDAFLIVIIAFIASFLLEQYLVSLHHHKEKGHTLYRATVPLIFIGDTIHNFIDGVSIAAAYIVDPIFGFIVTLATFLHETPHEIGDFGVFLSSGMTRAKTFKLNLYSALATFPGAFITYFFFKEAPDKIAVLLAISGGIFLFLGASDFLPEVGEDPHAKGKWKEVTLVLLGIVLMYCLSLITPEH